MPGTQDEEVDRILLLAGVASSPIDPPSLCALKELLRERKLGVATLATGASMPKAAPTPSNTPLHPSSFAANYQKTTNQQIVEILNMHTRMMMDTQREIQDLVMKVRRLEDRLEATSGLGALQHDPVEQQGNNKAEEEPVPLQNHSAPPPQPGIFSRIQKMYGWRLARLFYLRSQGFVRPLDGGLMFKLIFTVVVMSARISKTSLSQGRFQISFLLVVSGFLWHTRYVQYVYHFFVKENIPRRLWAGEVIEAYESEVDAAPVVHPRHGRLPVERLNNNERNMEEPRQQRQPDARGPLVAAFLGGVIPLRNDNALLALLTDILCLVGSFLLSIFPVWQPIEGPQGRRQQQDNVNDVHEGNEQVEEN